MLFHAILSDNKKANTLQRATINYYNPIFAKKTTTTRLFMGNGTHTHNTHTHSLSVSHTHTQTHTHTHTRKNTLREKIVHFIRSVV